MSAISIKGFGGLKPMTDPLLLDTADATVAQNVRLMSGALTALQGTTTLKSLGIPAANTIFRYGTSSDESQYWLEWSGDVDVVRSPVAADPYARIYWTDGVKPKYAPSTLILSGSVYPGASYDLGLPAPSAAPTVSGTTPTTASTSETRTYLSTFVTAYGEEGPPSNASAPATINPALAVNLSGLPSVPAGYNNITARRIYRSSTVGSNAEWQFVAEIPVAQTTYSDTISQANLGEILPSDLWVAPPAGLRGLKLMANGAAIGFVDNTAYLSEPNMPHAWPHQYPTDAKIVGIGVFRTTAVLLTDSYPYALSGVDPQAMSMEKLELPQACLSKRSIVDTGDGTMYASPDGLVSIGSGGMSIVTNNLFTRKQWQAFNPSSFVSFGHDGRYHAFYTLANGTRGLLIIDFSGQGAVLTTSNLNTQHAVTAGYADPRSDTLYLAQNGSIVRFNAGSPLTYVWRSKMFRLPMQAPFSVASVDASAYPVTARIYADGNLIHTQTVTSKRAFRLPTGFRAQDWQFELEGTADITRFRVAHSVVELMAV